MCYTGINDQCSRETRRRHEAECLDRTGVCFIQYRGDRFRATLNAQSARVLTARDVQ